MAQYLESFAPNVTEKQVVAAVHRVEDRFVFEHDQSTPAADGRQEALRHIWTGTENFANHNPQAINELVADLDRQDLLPQLAIAALDQAARKQADGHGATDSLTKAHALALIDRKDALGDALRLHIDRSFVVSPQSGFGGGYADAQALHSGDKGLNRYEPAISAHHLDDLNRNFSHPPGYKSTEMQVQEDQKASRWLPVLSWLSK